MRETLKRKIALYLTVLLLLPTIVNALPIRAEAATVLYATVAELQVEEGQKFYIGDYAFVNNGKTIYSLSTRTATYSSSKTSVASVNKKTGLVTAKKKGTTYITGKCAGEKVRIQLNVVKKGKLGTTTTYKKLVQSAEKVSKVFSSNPEEAIRRSKTYLKQLASINKQSSTKGWIDHNGVLWKNGVSKLLIPAAGRVGTLEATYSPLSTRSAKVFKPTKLAASSKSNNLTITLKNKAAGEQIAWLQTFNGGSGSGNQTTFTVYLIQDLTADKIYTGAATAKKGSKTITVKLREYSTGKAVKVVKGHKYKLMDEQSWGLGKTAKAK